MSGKMFAFKRFIKGFRGVLEHVGLQSGKQMSDA